MDYINISSQKVFSDADLGSVECVCGGKTELSEARLEYSVRHGKDISTLYLRCEKCSRNYRFVELQPHDFNSLPISLWISHKLREQDNKIKDKFGSIWVFLGFALLAITWIIGLFYLLTSEI